MHGKTKNIVMAVLLVLITIPIAAFIGDYGQMRWAGTNTLPSGTYYFIMDSTDTFPVDTFFSDTIVIGDFKWLNIGAKFDGFVLADSANDSMVIILNGIASFNGQFERIIWTDTIPTTLGTLDSTLEILAFVRVDTLAANRFFIRAIVKDSFISDFDSYSDKDSNEIRLRYEVGQTGTR